MPRTVRPAARAALWAKTRLKLIFILMGANPEPPAATFQADTLSAHATPRHTGQRAQVAQRWRTKNDLSRLFTRGFRGEEAVPEEQDHAHGDGAVGKVEHPGEMQGGDIEEVDHLPKARPIDQVVADRSADHQAQR